MVENQHTAIGLRGLRFLRRGNCLGHLQNRRGRRLFIFALRKSEKLAIEFLRFQCGTFGSGDSLHRHRVGRRRHQDERKISRDAREDVVESKAGKQNPAGKLSASR